ncbi:MAG: DNA-3-methyladenine glycosylase 2 family protein [Streptosporangiales bacterium]|nr:DNA-3-methyladenine glycosylase 2 family protein [Streptosporangiales bacterium]
MSRVSPCLAGSAELPIRGPFDLTASARFLEGFAPAGRPDAAAEPGSLRLAFTCSPSWRPVGVRIRQGGEVTADVYGEPTDVDAAAAHSARILSLDVDGAGFADVGTRDPVVARLQAAYPGLRPVLFHSPYEAACWTIIGHRIRIVQAAALKQRIAERIGDAVEFQEGLVLRSFPPPQRLLATTDIPGLPRVKLRRLHGVAAAALEGTLAAERLRGMGTTRALAELQRLPGIGPFSAELILVRGAGHPDVFPTAERRLHEEMVRTYRLENGSVQDLAAIAERWRPYRSWVALLFRTRREEDTAEIASGAMR